MKEYFTHDYAARLDIKIKQLMAKHGYAGYGLYWAIIEDLYSNANALPTDYDMLAYDMRVPCELLRSVIEDFGLFTIQDNTITSDSIARRMEIRKEKSDKARESANARWSKSEPNANAMRTHDNRNAIKEKESKEKKRVKEKEIEPPIFNGLDDVVEQLTDFKREMLMMKYKLTAKQIDDYTEQVLAYYAGRGIPVKDLYNMIVSWHLKDSKGNPAQPAPQPITYQKLT